MSGSRDAAGWKIILGQIVLLFVTTAVLLSVFDMEAAYSGLLGGLISIAANSVFAIRLFNDQGSWQAIDLTATLYRGLIGRYFLTIALFILTMALIEPLNITALFAVYLWVQVSPALIAGMLKI